MKLNTQEEFKLKCPDCKAKLEISNDYCYCNSCPFQNSLTSFIENKYNIQFIPPGWMGLKLAWFYRSAFPKTYDGTNIVESLDDKVIRIKECDFVLKLINNSITLDN